MRIKELELYSSNIEEQTAFYSNVLELEITEKSKESVTFKIGDSLLKFTYRQDITPYHYAFNIPANKEQEALKWLKERVEILKDGESEIQHFDFWDANAIYFYDKDKNIVEFIARRNLKNDSERPFTVSSLLEICEIGIPTMDIQRDFQILDKNAGLDLFSGNLERFASIGDAHGLFIMINKTIKKEWFPTQDQPYSSDFNLQFVEKGKVHSVEFKEEKLRFISSDR